MPAPSRRNFLKSCGAAAVGAATFTGGCASTRRDILPDPDPAAAGIIDPHVHFYDPSRPGGVPWPPRNDSVLYRTVLPDEYKRLATPLGVRGVVVVEASPLVEDNQWLLDLAAREPFILGIVGNLGPGEPDFAANVARFARNPLYRGIRLRERPWQSRLDDKAFLDDLRRLADANLQMDINAAPTALPDMAKLAERVPALRIVVDHVGNIAIDGHEPTADWLAAMKSLGALPNVWCKVSGLVEGASRPSTPKSARKDKPIPTDLAYYRGVLDALWQAFGDKRLLYASNWPVSAKFADLPTVLALAKSYFSEKGAQASARVFSLNAAEAYQVARRG